MTKASSARREAPHSAPPEELAEENGRAEFERTQLPPSVPDPALIAAVAEVRHHDDLYEQLLDGSWLPSTPAEVAAALRTLAECHDNLYASHSVPSLPSLEKHGAELERRLALLEQRLDPDADYRPAALHYDGALVSNDDDEDNPLNMLWANHHEPDGTRSAPKGSVMDEPLDDIENGHLRPQTWAQMCDCLSELARATHMVLTGLIEVEEGAIPMQRLVANLTRAVASTTPRPPHDVAEALVLETVTRLRVDRREEEAHEVESMWRMIDDYSHDRYQDGTALKNWKLVRADGLGAAGVKGAE